MGSPQLRTINTLRWVHFNVIRTVAVIIATTLIAACTVSFPMRPSSLHKQATAASNGRFDAVDAIHLQPLPFSVLSLSASEIVGNAKHRQSKFKLIAQFDVAAARGQKLHYRILSSVTACTPASVDFAVLAESVMKAFENVDASVIPVGVIDLRLIPKGASFAATTMSFNLGRRISLRFYRPCLDDSSPGSVVDTLALLDVSMHEISHAMNRLYLRGAAVQNEKRSELLADYSVGCLYQALEQTAQGRDIARQYPLPVFFSEAAVETGGAQTSSPAESCRIWASWVAKARS